MTGVQARRKAWEMFLSLLKKKNKKNPNLVLDFFFETGFYSVAQASLEFIVN